MSRAPPETEETDPGEFWRRSWRDLYTPAELEALRGIPTEEEEMSATQTPNGPPADLSSPAHRVKVPETPADGGGRIQAIKDAQARRKAANGQPPAGNGKPMSSAEKGNRFRALIERLGRDATDKQIGDAAEAEGLPRPSTVAIWSHRTPAGGKPRGEVLGVTVEERAPAVEPAPKPPGTKTGVRKPRGMRALAAADPTPGINLTAELEDLPRRLAELKKAVEELGGQCSFSLRIVGLTLKYEG